MFLATGAIRPVGWAPLLVGACLVVPACSGPRKFHKHPVFVTESDAARYLRQALEADSADERRSAIVRLSRTRYAGRDTVVRGMVLIAKTDASPCVRSAAVRALEKTGDPKIIGPLLAILAPPGRRDPGTLAPDDLVRWDAVHALATLVESSAGGGEQREAITATAIRLLKTDRSRDVRVAAAALLGNFRSREALDALIQALDQRDFGVVYTSERSLMRLTGHAHDHDPAAWRAWVRGTDDPFADAGRLDSRLHPPKRNWFRRTWDSTVRALASYRPKPSSSS